MEGGEGGEGGGEGGGVGGEGGGEEGVKLKNLLRSDLEAAVCAANLSVHRMCSLTIECVLLLLCRYGMCREYECV